MSLKGTLAGRKGQSLVLVALAMALMLGAAGLAIDVGMAYGIRTKLVAALDAASLAAANTITKGQEAASRTAAEYFNANFPKKLPGSAHSDPVVDTKQAKNGDWYITVSASARMPTFFGGIIGWKNINVGATSQSTRPALDVVLALDNSGSLDKADPSDHSGRPAFDTVKSSSKSFVDFFNPSDDRFSLVTFSTGAYPVVSICGTYPNPTQNPPAGLLTCQRGFDKSSIKNAIDRLRATGATASEEGMKKALDQLNSLQPDTRAQRRVIVFFSDGSPNTFNGNFLTTAGYREGNLFSEYATNIRPFRLYNSRVSYDDSYMDLSRGGNLVSLPAYDSGGTVPLAGFNKDMRPLSGLTDDAHIQCDANKAARNMAENAAEIARNQGITVYTLGYGSLLDGSSEETSPGCSTHYEKGSTILKRMANSPDSDTYSPSQPTGLYCYAKTTDDLEPCFDKIWQAIRRICK